MPERIELELMLPDVLDLRVVKPPAELPADIAMVIAGKAGEAAISADAGNRATNGTDGGVYVRDDLIPDPLAYYILAKA
ncbi:MAG: hypothetical protein EOO29_16110 [Comamonadaceae bacterium]|nr:MAG: hypothetical protein EOO29_16110 [Comamonadaceae bacterium]